MVGAGHDEQLHYLLCARGDVVRVVALEYPLVESCMEWLLLGSGRGGLGRLRTLLVLDVSPHAFRCAPSRLELGSSAQLAFARLKDLRRRHP